MKKRLKNKLKKKGDLAYAEWLYKEEQDYNWELTSLLEKCLPHLPESELKTDINRVITAAKI
jgi:hypothetical protein